MVSASGLRRPIEYLATIDRESCSPGERRAAAWIADALNERGAAARIEEEVVHGTYWWPLGLTAALGVGGALAGLRGRRILGLAAGAIASGLVYDDLSAGARWLRRVLPKRRTVNVIGETGDREAQETIIFVAHHDAAHSGFFFNPRIEQRFGGLLRRGGEKPPNIPGLMVPIVAAPALAGAGSLLRSRRLTILGGLVCGGIMGSFLDIALRGTVPGANDNLTGVSTLLALAEALREQPAQGIRVILLSTGAEESLMDGMWSFARRHFRELDRARTRIICVDSVGSPYLVLAEAEGMLRIRPYDRALKHLIAECAATSGIELVRGLTIRVGTDGYLGLRHGYPAAMLMSVDASGAASNYHWPTDTPDRVDYRTLAAAVTVCEQVVRRLAQRPDHRSGVSWPGYERPRSRPPSVEVP